MIHHIKRATWHLIFWSLLLSALALTSVRLLLIGIDSYKASLEVKIGAVLDSPVRLGKLGAHMRGITPELVLRDINVIPAITSEEPPVHVKEIRWGLNLGQYLLNRELLPASAITLVGAELSLYRDKTGHFGVTGLKPRPGQPLWLFQGQYNLLDSRITWQDFQKGEEPVVFEGLNAAVINDGNRHRINAFTALPAVYGGDIKLAAEIEGVIEEPEHLTGKVYAEGEQVRLAHLISGLPMDIRLLRGRGNFKLWGQWQSGALANLTGIAELKDTVLERDGAGRLPLKSLKADFTAASAEDGWRLDFNHLILQTESEGGQKGRLWPDAVFSLGYHKAAAASPEKISLYVQEMDLGEIMQLSRIVGPAESALLREVQQADPKGIVKKLFLYAEPETKQYALTGEFQGLGFEPAAARPGLANLSGKVKASDAAGVIDLNSADGLFVDSRIFGKALPFSRLKGTLNWRNGAEKWELSSGLAELDCPAFASRSRLSLVIPKTDAEPLIDLQIGFESQNVSQIKNYLPAPLLKEQLHYWLSNAFLAGKAGKGVLLFYGEPKSFPFKDNSGVFQAALELNNVQLKFRPDWPHINGIHGQLAFDKDVIEGRFDGGQIGKVKINPTQMTVSGLSNTPQLLIKGESEGEAADMLKVLQQSPLAFRVNPLLKHAKTSGYARASLNLLVPFTSERPVQAEAGALLENVQILPNDLNAPLSQINGELKFNGEGAFGKELTGQFLGQPVAIGVNTANQQTVIKLEGRAGVADLERITQMPEAVQAEGQAAYTLELAASQTQPADSALQITFKSDLEGVKLDLPGGLAKISAQKKPLAVALKASENSPTLPLQLNYNNELKAALIYSPKEQKLVSGHVLIGSGTPSFSLTSGLKLEVNRTPLALQDWLKFYSGTGSGADAAIREIRLRSGSAFWNNTRLGGFDLDLKRNAGFWSGEIDSQFAKGVFDLPFDFYSFKPAVMTMEMVNLSLLKQLSGEVVGGSAADIKILPTLRSNKTLWRSEDLGRLSLETQAIPLGVKIKNLSIEGPDEILSATGTWEKTGNASLTQLQGTLVMNRADLLFNKLNITKDFTETGGNVNFQLIWNAPPLQLSLPGLRGHMDVNLRNGRILSIEPGFGRVLGILAVEQWVKRLQLDFSDIFAEGLTYNSIKGDFNLLNGKATTKNLFIDAVPAKINIEGNTDLVKQRVDHLVKVVPKSSDAVPIAGTIVGKVANLIGKTLTGKDQDGFFFGRQYLVRGGWDSISVKPLHENDGILQKTWNNITDFPWVE